MKNIVKFSIVKTIPVMVGFLFMGAAYGLLLQRSGYNVIWALFTSIFIYAGSIQFILVSFLGTDISLISVFILTLTINSRHIFYGLSFIDKFKSMKKAYPYMIFSLTDETYSLLSSVKVPENLDEKKVFLTISALNQLYWVTGSVLGSLIGQFVNFDSKGIDFAMTALFVVIFLDQWKNAKTKIPAILGLGLGIASRLVFGPGNFILPALFAAIIVLLVFKKSIESKEALHQ